MQIFVLIQSLEDCQAELEVKSDKLRSVQSVLQERDEELKKVSQSEVCTRLAHYTYVRICTTYKSG